MSASGALLSVKAPPRGQVAQLSRRVRRVAVPGYRDRRRLAAACALIPRILASTSALPDRSNSELVVVSAELTSTGVAVAVLAPPDQPPRSVIKMPMTTEALRALERESGELAALHADERLGDWRDLVPRPGASGTVAAQPYRVDSALPGSSVLDQLKDEAMRLRLQAAAADTIHFLHRTTARTVAGNSGLAERWIDGPLRDLARHGLRRPFAYRLERLRDELHSAVSRCALSTSQIHGDYWLGNLLFAGDESAAGIVDWGAGAPSELPIHDVLHLLLYTRRLVSGEELGKIVRRQLTAGEWPASERRLLERYGAWCHDGSLSDRHALLLYWLRQVALHARQQARPAGYRYRLWEMRNVYSVVAAL
jgi:aminoglycoside phosphotransferase (APT) family kinase protein